MPLLSLPARKILSKMLPHYVEGLVNSDDPPFEIGTVLKTSRGHGLKVNNMPVKTETTLKIGQLSQGENDETTGGKD
jgi:hypothetical protein